MKARFLWITWILGLVLAACSPAGSGSAAPGYGRGSAPAAVKVADSPAAPGPTQTLEPTGTALPSDTPSLTPSLTETVTPSLTPSFTPSQTPSRTFTPLPTRTFTRTVTPRPLPSATPLTARVSIANYAFSPQNLTIKVGTTVTWKNQDADAHSVTANDSSWGSGLLAKGDTYSHKFTQAGSYSYHCGVHPGMTGSITVQP